VAGGGSFDAWFAWIDATVFGFDPSRVFSATFSGYPVINEIMFAAYFSFYVILAFVPWLPWFAGRREAAIGQLAIFSGFMFVVFTFYIFFRVQGPKYWFPDLRIAWYGHFKGGPFTAFFARLFEQVNLSGAAFPSSHVAVSIMLSIFAWRYDRRLGILLAVLTALIMAATVYIYAHWVADVVGGILAIMILFPILEALGPRLDAFCRSLDGQARDLGKKAA
jgi:membrane-associated phospholipid phosphatase